ncbi:ArsR family transcriptional regulator [Yersinia sp. 2545 StPb PI]|uniref:ArsR family transcriptional regulator n=1 Tax=Yersinia sp. 2545 StPb PI TaxID=3117410 RepID=UPI003FA4C80D
MHHSIHESIHMLSLETLLRQKPATASYLAQAMAISQPTVSRQLSGLKERVLKIGKGKATQYALRRYIAGDSARQMQGELLSLTTLIERMA